jgi:hypothetical protein
LDANDNITKKIMKVLLLFFLLSCGFSFSQESPSIEIPGKIYTISISALRNNVRMQRTSAKKIKNIQVALPDMNGTSIYYNLFENEVSETRLKDLTNFDGISDDGLSKLKLSLYNDRFEAIVKCKEGFYYIEPYQTSVGNYRVYPAFANFGKNFSCNILEDEDILESLNTVKSKLLDKASATNFPYGNQLRKFRMAIATTGEFTQAFAGNQDNAVAEAIAILNLINLIYESEVSITFSAISKTTDKSLIFTDPITDPFNVDAAFANAGNSQTGFNTLNTNGTLPFSLYDIGHTFNIIASGGGRGQAGMQLCFNTSKARAWSEWTLTLPKSIITSLIVHEMAHQFGAGHTYNASGGNTNNSTFCTNGWSSTAAVEPGAGSTIMSYGNSCTTPNDQTNTGNNKLNYFNAKSLDQIVANLASSATCFTAQATSNKMPIADAGADIIIPKNTPFLLKGTGTDSNDTNLSYTWEQADNATTNDQGAFGNTIAGNGGYTANNSTARAPLFRSVQSTANGERIFPNLRFVLNNANVPPSNEAEVLPAVARSIKFRFTVRDNNVQSGGVDSDEMTVFVSNNGPLEVVFPNEVGDAMAALSTQTITWNVNGTNALNANVNILLSIDGGASYTYQLAMNTPNDGSQTVKIPNSPSTTTARIKVVAIINPNAEYFDVSDDSFTIISTCNANQSFISPTNSVSTVSGSLQSNLNMTIPPASGSTYTSKTIDYSLATNNNIIAYSNATKTTARVVLNNYPSIAYSFRVTESGTYRLSKPSSGFLIISVHSGTPFSIANFIASNANNTTGTSYSTAFHTENLPLLAGTTYFVMSSNFSNPANNLSYTISSSGPGSLYEVSSIPVGNSYTYIAVNNADNKIKALSATANFSSLPVGTYTVQGISFPSTIDSATFINNTVAELVTVGNCFATSVNARTLQLNQSLGIAESTTSSNEFILVPNPVENFLNVTSSIAISDYQIFDLVGRLIQSKKVIENKMDVSNLKTGIYIIKLLNDGKMLHQEKIIKN